MALATRPETGLTIDYNLVGPLTNFVFKAGETYWVNTNTTVNFWGVTRLEGGSVVKFSLGPLSRMLFNGALECLTAEYAPMFFVGKDDDSIGSVISGSSGQPGYTNYVSRALDLNSASANYDLKHLRFRNVEKAIVLSAGTLTVSHTTVSRSQFFFQYGGATDTNRVSRFRNVLGYELANAGEFHVWHQHF